MTLLKEFSLTTHGNKEARRVFELETRCVTSLFERLFPKFKTEDCWKVLVNCSATPPRNQYCNLLGVYEIDAIVDIEKFSYLDNEEKKAWSFACLELGITQLLKQTTWDEKPFIETFRRMEAIELKNVWVWNSVISPNKDFIGEVLIKHEVEKCVISFIVRDNSGQQICGEEIITDQPDEWAYSRHLGALVWESDSQLILTNKKKNKTWQISIA